MIDDETPTPRPFKIDLEQLAAEERKAQERAAKARASGNAPSQADEEAQAAAALLAQMRASQAPVGGPATSIGVPMAASAPDPEVASAPPRPPHRDPGTGAAPQPEPRPYTPIAGPEDRVSFFAEQARHRRATWQLSAASTVVVIVAGLPLALVVTPIIFMAIILFTKLASLVIPVSPAVPELYRSVASLIGATMTAIEVSDKGPVPPALMLRAALGVLMVLLPGVLTMLAIWFFLRRLFSGAGVGGLVIGLGARPPVPTDLEERQLVNVVEEMALAAGLPAPKVMLLDGQIANAAVVGSSPNDAVLVVSRRLLDEMDRDETQGVLAHLIASIGNGDLGVALSMVTVFRTFGLVNTLLDAPISSSARATLWRLFKVLRGSHGTDQAVRSAEVARLIGSRVSMMSMEDVDLVLGNDMETSKAPKGVRGWILKARVFALFPIWAAAGMAKTVLMLFIFGLLGPLMAWTWRARRYLADATAVQLTRNPDGIAQGLQGLMARGGGIRGGAWADHLFVVGGGVTNEARVNEAVMEQLRAEAEAEGEGKSTPERIAARLRAGQKYAAHVRAESEASEAKDSDMGGLSWISFHPSLPSRLKRLRAMGAHVDEAVFKSRMTGQQMAIMAAVITPLAAVVAVLLGVAIVLATGLVIVFMMIPMGIVYWTFELLF